MERHEGNQTNSSGRGGRAGGRVKRDTSIVIRDRETYDAAEANLEMADTLRRKVLRRRARANGLELRRSDYGYSLIDGARNRVGDRNDLTLDDVETHLDSTPRR